MVRPSQERATRVLTELQSLTIGDGTDTDDDGVDFPGGGTNPGGGGDTGGDQAGTKVHTIIDSSTWDGLIDYSLARWWDITLTSDITIALIGAPADGLVGRLHVVIRQGPGAPWVVTWADYVLWRDTDGTEGGAAPNLAVVEDALDVFVFTTFDGGDTWGGQYDGSSSGLTLQLVADSGTAVDIDWSYDVIDITITDDVVYSFVNLPASATPKVITIIRRMGPGGPWSESWPASVEWEDGDTGLPGGAPQTLKTGDGARTIAALFTEDGGTSVAGSFDKSGSSAAAIEILDEGASLTTTPTSIDFVGAGVTATAVGDDVTVTISGAPTGAAGGDLGGTYPNPTVTDDSHSHTAATLPASGGASEHAHVVEETHLSDGSTVTWTLDQAYEPGSVIAWNTTSIARLTVTEVLPDKATVSAAGSSGDKIVFDYAATLA